MNLSMDGRKVRNFVCAVKHDPPDDLIYGVFTEPHYYVFSATHHGDRDEFWVLLMVNGKEAMRWNARHVASIEWEAAS